MCANPRKRRLLIRLAMAFVAVAAACSTADLEASVVVALDDSSAAVAPMPAVEHRSHPARSQDDAKLKLLATLLAFRPTEDGMGTTTTPTIAGGGSPPAIAESITDLPQPLLITWLHTGQYLALPSLPPSGLFRPPRCA